MNVVDGSRMKPTLVTRLLFCSSPTNAPDSVILDIIRISEERNLALGCSGLLAYGRTGYAQIIEGADHCINQLRDSILRDPRHIVLWHDTARKRPRLIRPCLPMGYISTDSEGLRLSLSPRTCATSDLVALLDAGRRKYPSAMC